MTDIFELAGRVAAALNACGIRYLIGGSMASSIMGEPRSTLDLDVVVELTENQLPALADALGADFYFDREQARGAVRSGSSVNAIHEPTGLKVDFFMARTALDRRQLDRRLAIAAGPRRETLFVYTAEDILLQKLRWFRLGGEVSERQWRDVLGILLTQGDRLDRGYVEREAEALGLAELWRRALGQARGPA